MEVAIISKFIIKIAANAGALFVAGRFISGFEITPFEFVNLGFLGVSPFAQSLIAGGLALAIANLILWPLLRVLDLLLPLISYGVLSVVFNGLLLYFADLYLPQLTISGFTPLIWSSILIGIVNTIL